MSAVRRTLATILAVLSLLGLAAGAASASGPQSAEGTTPIQNNTGLLTVFWTATSQQSINSVGGDFKSVPGVGNPRLHVRLLDDRNNEVDQFEQSWTGVRFAERVEFPVNRSYDTPVSRVCASLYEGGGLMDTACQTVYMV